MPAIPVTLQMERWTELPELQSQVQEKERASEIRTLLGKSANPVRVTTRVFRQCKHNDTVLEYDNTKEEQALMSPLHQERGLWELPARLGSGTYTSLLSLVRVCTP